MQIQMNAEELSKGLYRAQGIVDRKATMPILANILLDASDGKVTLSATDLELGLQGTHPAEVIKPGKITVPARNLLDIIKNLPEKNFTMTKSQNNWVEIVSGRYRSRLVGAEPNDFPELPTIDDVNFVEIDAAVFGEMIDKTHFAVSTDETRYNLNGVYLEVRSENTRMVATDGHRLSMVQRKLGAPLGLSKGVIIPRKGLAEMKRLLTEKHEKVSLGFSGSNAVFKTEGLSLVMRLVDGTFPDYEQVIPEGGKHPLLIERDRLLSTLKRVSLVSPDRAPAVKLQLAKGTLTVVSENPELGEASEALEVNYEGGDVTVGFNARYVIDVLSVLSCEEIVIEIADELSPGLIRPKDDPDFTAVVMPMRI